jgi:hypothetical protein
MTDGFLLFTGEQGKVDESMREMAAIEALKSEKADKEVCHYNCRPTPVLIINSFLERTSTTHRYFGSVRTPEAARVRRLWCIPIRARL